MSTLNDAIDAYKKWCTIEEYDQALPVLEKYLNQYKEVLCTHYDEFCNFLMSNHESWGDTKIKNSAWAFIVCTLFTENNYELATYYLDNCPGFCRDCFSLTKENPTYEFVKYYVKYKKLNINM